MVNLEPPKLSFFRRRGSEFGVLYLSRATSRCPVSTVITCRCALVCGGAAGATHEVVLLPVEFSPWT